MEIKNKLQRECCPVPQQNCCIFCRVPGQAARAKDGPSGGKEKKVMDLKGSKGGQGEASGRFSNVKESDLVGQGCQGTSITEGF